MARNVSAPFFLVDKPAYLSAPAVKKRSLVFGWESSNVLLLTKMLHSMKMTRRNASSINMIGMITRNTATIISATNGIGIIGKTRRTNAARCPMAGMTTRSAALITSIESGITTTKTVSVSPQLYQDNTDPKLGVQSTTSRVVKTSGTTGMISKNAATISNTRSGIMMTIAMTAIRANVTISDMIGMMGRNAASIMNIGGGIMMKRTRNTSISAIIRGIGGTMMRSAAMIMITRSGITSGERES